MAAHVRGHVAPSQAAGGSSRSVGTQGGRGGGTACPWGDRWELPPHRRAWVFSCPSWVPFLSQGAGTTCGSVLGCSCPRSHPQPAPFHKWGNRGTTWQRPSLLSSAGEEQAGDRLPGVPRRAAPPGVQQGNAALREPLAQRAPCSHSPAAFPSPAAKRRALRSARRCSSAGAPTASLALGSLPLLVIIHRKCPACYFHPIYYSFT